MALLRLEGVSVHFRLRGRGRGGGVVRAVDEVDLTINEGEVLGIVGESGCGKTTLGRVIVGLQRPTSGDVIVRGERRSLRQRPGANARADGFQMVYQDAAGSLNPWKRIGWSIAEPLRNEGMRKPRMRERVLELLDQVGLPDSLIDQYPGELSGGQQQRAAIARALAGRPRLIVLDEAVSSLDMSTQAQVLNLLKDLAERHSVNYVFISHDIAAVDFMSDRVAVMYLGRIVELEDAHDRRSPLVHPYSITLRSAVPVPDPVLERRRKRIVLTGPVASATDLPSGCRFHTRCPIAQPLCADSEPELVRASATSRVACHFTGEFDDRYAASRTGGSG
ncbi:MAG: ABC transporter ATP-binding protein [bacterium]|nr:ABC transporter ATP-binding protein [bacterium]MDE0439773.1 ABC transporter ATP-binding protein [bacterium]